MGIYYTDTHSTRRRLHVVLSETKQEFTANASQSFTSKIGESVGELYDEISDVFDKLSKLKHPAFMVADKLEEELDELGD